MQTILTSQNIAYFTTTILASDMYMQTDIDFIYFRLSYNKFTLNSFVFTYEHYGFIFYFRVLLFHFYSNVYFFNIGDRSEIANGVGDTKEEENHLMS